MGVGTGVNLEAGGANLLVTEANFFITEANFLVTRANLLVTANFFRVEANFFIRVDPAPRPMPWPVQLTQCPRKDVEHQAV